MQRTSTIDIITSKDVNQLKIRVFAFLIISSSCLILSIFRLSLQLVPSNNYDSESDELQRPQAIESDAF